MMQRNWWTAITSRKILRREQNADGADGKQGGKVFSIQLFSFKKLLFRYDGLNLRAYNLLKMSTFTDVWTPEQEAALKALIEQLKEEYPEATVHGHNEFASKDCPCFDVKKEWGE